MKWASRHINTWMNFKSYDLKSTTTRSQRNDNNQTDKFMFITLQWERIWAVINLPAKYPLIILFSHLVSFVLGRLRVTNKIWFE